MPVANTDPPLTHTTVIAALPAGTPDKQSKQTKPMSQSRSGHASAVAHGIIQSPVEIQSGSDEKNSVSGDVSSANQTK